MTSPDLPFIVRAWPVDAAAMPVETHHAKFGLAIDVARQTASLPAFRSVQVLDLDSMCYAQFSMLWVIPDDFA